MKKTLALLSAVILCLSGLAGCGKSGAAARDPATVSAEPAKETGRTAPTAAAASDTPLTIGYAPFNGVFSPFFSETACDRDVQAMTQLTLLSGDRTGAMILNGIQGETVSYNGTDYTYYGPADLTITEADDGAVFYDFTLRDDLKFSDGEPLTVDDVIFSMYVLCDPTYDGSATLYAQPIEGMEAYRSGMDTLFNLLVAAGRDNTDFRFWTKEEQEAFWADMEQAGTAFAQEIIDCCAEAGYCDGSGDVRGGAGVWGFALAEDSTATDFFYAMCEDYAWDLGSLSAAESAGSELFDLMENYSAYTRGVAIGESAPRITGIRKTGDNSLRIVMTKQDATALYQLGLAIAPMHYYGERMLYDYDNNMFGFPKGDLRSVRARNAQPMGAGPYRFVGFENGTVSFAANEFYFKGCPKTGHVSFRECAAEEDKLNGVLSGDIDISDPAFSRDAVTVIEKANGGTLCGAVVETCTVDNLGYGYIGIAASRVNVGGVKESDASRNLRRAIATVLSVYRDAAIDAYYGDRASVINYPISDTSWAAPQSTDDGYRTAFSVDVNGKDIYTASMRAEDRYAAALKASLGFFEAAGYTVENGKLTAAPEGAALEYACWIPANGTGDHPAYTILTEARDALAAIGFRLTIRDLANADALFDALDADEVDMWAAAWGATVDPDLYQIYHSSNIAGLPGSTGDNYYHIQDGTLDRLIMEARASVDQTYRKAVYRACLDILADWAVEVPVYQRQNAVIFSAERVRLDTVTPDITTFYGWMSEVEKVAMQ